MRDSVITKGGQTTIPKPVRDALDLKEGDKIRYVVVGDNVRIMKMRSIKELKGALARSGQKTVSLEEMDEAIADGARESLGFLKLSRSTPMYSSVI